MRDELIEWLRNQQQKLDQIICKAAQTFYDQKSQSDFMEFDIRQTSQELFQLRKGEDLCYDRPSIAFSYSLWYHAKRVNTCLTYLLESLFSARGHVDIFDLGAGTGAVQWAVGLIYAGMKELGMKVPTLKIVSIDTSPFMLEYSRDYLWQYFKEVYEVCDEIDCEYKTNSWTYKNPSDNEISNPWIVASYLFDSSDNKEAIAEDFAQIIDDYDPNVVILLTSKKKREFVDEVVSDIKGDVYESIPLDSKARLYEGKLEQVNQFRGQFESIFKGEAHWDEEYFYGSVLVRKQAFLFPRSQLNISLYGTQARRKDIQLNAQQKKVSQYVEAPTIIIGSAGSGKSVVLTEMVKNLVEEKDYHPSLRILITTFNKGLIQQLGDWLEEILDDQRSSRHYPYKGEAASYFKFTDSEIRHIDLMHFDILPTRIGKISGHIAFDGELKRILKEVIDEVIDEFREEKGLVSRKYADILTPDFILEEYRRVRYGLQYTTKEKYLSQTRVGRGRKPRLVKGGKKRKVIWGCIVRFLEALARENKTTFTGKRDKFLHQLINGNDQGKYSHIFVDEVQDCTPADVQIFAHLLKDPNHLVVTGDWAQAVHIGRSYMQKFEGMKEAKRWRKKRLKGSYRLPIRISEALAGLSKRIKIVHSKNSTIHPSLINPFKGAPPGARPIVVFASTLDELAQKVATVFRYYNIFEIEGINIFEQDWEFCGLLKKQGLHAETDTILRTKGLEKDCVLWSTRIEMEGKHEDYEIAYTILTRTKKILIITLSPETKAKYHKVINTLKKDRLILWDEETSKNFDKFCEEVTVKPEDDE